MRWFARAISGSWEEFPSGGRFPSVTADRVRLEGAGVSPDISVSSDEALRTAIDLLRRIRSEAAPGRNGQGG